MPRLTASDNPAYSVGRFGYSVAISGDTVVVGAPHTTVGDNAWQGAAYVFTEPASGWTNMTQTAKLTASDGKTCDYFGDSVAISGNTVAVGAYSATVGGDICRGAAYVFAEPASGWTNMTQTAKLTSSRGAVGNDFGGAIAISGNTVVVGAPGRINALLGLVPSSIVGAGAAYVFTEPGTGWANMTETAKLTPSDSAANNRFGGSVSISGDTVVVGAYDATVGGHACQGAAYVYTMPGDHWTSMTQTAKLTPLDGGACNYFGTSVSIDGDLVAVADGGGNGVTYLFTESGSRWSQTAKLIPPNGGPGGAFDGSVSLDGGTLLVAATEGNNNWGAAYLFSSGSSGAGPTLTGLSTAQGPASGGTAVTITGTNLAGATVHFGSTIAKIITDTATTITVVSPVRAGLVNVTVTTPNGTSPVTSADKFTYLAAPVVTGVGPGQGPLAGGTEVTITGTGLAGATAVKFGGKTAIVLEDTATQIEVYSPAGTAGQVNVTVVTAGGTSALSAADKFTYLAPPTVTKVSPAQGYISGGEAGNDHRHELG